MIFALVKDNLIKNMIVAEQDFIDLIKKDWDNCVQVIEPDPSPGIGWRYADGVFLPPSEEGDGK